MAAINQPTVQQIVSLPVGLRSDGGNPYFPGWPGGSRQWVMRYRFGGR
ncbi:Arm DNA-binding domain-containing protein [Methylobacterium aerolatum]|uniref:Uncharacterized protein n=1 Tax=Methylobacterium aerolatum TaxID=418708 RepID=A0ABU0I2I4_9HYPH|nr:Arm DNA-binding domain-containing protein [Methylobacterium aerolatum]MDQ0448803.1 hypothetical protein [Methylobacterium aerolatum]GJD34072.1 hypothetical protein FMGBMHLM_0968 [Methylobacterium aerolatum]